MTDREQHDLLIRLDINQATIVDAMTELKKDIKKLSERPCATNTEKIRTMEWVIRTALGASILSLVRSFWPTSGG